MYIFTKKNWKKKRKKIGGCGKKNSNNSSSVWSILTQSPDLETDPKNQI